MFIQPCNWFNANGNCFIVAKLMEHFPFGLTQLQGSWHIFHFFSQAQIDGTFSVCFDPVTGLKQPCN
jgi:hypothetical protein